MKILQNPKIQFLLFIVFFFLLNVVQSHYTGLLNDEYYYWVWSKDLDFGYFDHPPLVALWIKISSFFFDGALGVRFFSTISFLITLWLVWITIDHKEKWQFVWLYFLLIFSVALVNVFGFITVPDTPLLMFTALFLYAYKQFLKNPRVFYSLLLGFSMAGLLYSKYHGILIIGFIVLSNFKLLKSKRFWVAGIFGFLLFIPHIHWQIIHDFPSIKYHLLERSKRPYSLENTLMHFVNLIAIVGVTFPVIYAAFFKRRIRNSFENGLTYIVYGFIIFFFFSSFKSSTQAQWNGSILIPLVILTFGYFTEHTKIRKWLVYLGFVNFILLMVARIFFASESISPVKLEPHGNIEWASLIKQETDGKPVVFIGSYKNASKYNFLTGIRTYSFSTLKTRKSQYDLKDFEQKIQNLDVAVIGKKIQGKKIYGERKGTHFLDTINKFISFQKIACKLRDKVITIDPGKKQKIEFEIYNPYDININFNTIHFVGIFQGEKNSIIEEIPMELEAYITSKPEETKEVVASFTTDVKLKDQEVKTFRVALKFYNLPAGFQGNKVKVNFQDE